VKRRPVDARLALVFAVFVAVGAALFWRSPGDDLSSSYIGCRLVLEGRSEALYAHDPTLFHVVDDPAWKEAAHKGRFGGFLHPYVQTPLWAYVLQPACASLGFPWFRRLFLLLGLLSLCATYAWVARDWAPRLRDWRWAAASLAVLGVSMPFIYAMWLTQTHALFIALSVFALVSADRGRSARAGTALAVAATVKLTPALLLVYWAARGQWRAVAWCLAASVALLLATLLAAGPQTLAAYVDSMKRVSNVLLLSFNNQSLPAAWAGRGAAGELWNWTIFPLAPGIKWLTTALSLLAVAAGGLIDRHPARRGIGACVALVGMTVFAPIAWSHYYIVLLPAVMVLADRSLAPADPGRAVRAALLSCAVLIVVLNLWPVALDPLHAGPAARGLVRSHFYSALLALAALAWLARVATARSAARTPSLR
jgi:hypothetical protein